MEVKMSEMKRCPFCGNKVREDYPYFYYHEEMGLWVFDHNCETRELKLNINLWGDTRQEVIERWNHRAEIEESESL
jgi:hypothetical protein